MVPVSQLGLPYLPGANAEAAKQAGADIVGFEEYLLKQLKQARWISMY